jgi:hypothetical protein
MEGIIPPEGGIDIPGPIDWENTSHGLKYDTVNFTVQTWGFMGPNRAFRLMTRIRPMCESEVIHAKLEGYSRETVLKAYGVDLAELTSYLPPPKQIGWIGKMWFYFKKGMRGGY